MISGAARLAGVIGWPVRHSRSPRLHNHWLALHGIDGAYVPLAVHPGQFAEAVAGLRAAGFAGVNVTLPHKEAAFALCDTLDHAARRAGAVNTLVFKADGVHGMNTDGAGFVANLVVHGIDPATPALLLGAGGAARAVAAALLDAGATVTIANRSVERAQALADVLPKLRVVDWSDRETALVGKELLVNTTSLGMNGHAALDMDLSVAARELAVADIVYVPLKTRLIADAEGRALRTAPGLGMLLHQAVPGFAAWFGVTPVVDQSIHDLLASDMEN